MRLLVLDSSGLVASVALMEDDRLIAEYTTGHKMTHSQTLLPMLDEVVQRTAFSLEDIDAIAVAMGPGSFTGLRIGAATAKGLGLALDKPIIPVPTVDGMAYQLFGAGYIICPMMDARRQQVYTGFYRFDGEKMLVLKEQCAQSAKDTLEQLKEYKEPVIFLGDGVPVNKEMIQEILGDAAIFAPVHANRQRAAAVGALAGIYTKKEKQSVQRNLHRNIRESHRRNEKGKKEFMDKSKATAGQWHVRKAAPEELPMIAEIERITFKKPWNLQSIESFYYKKTSDIYVWRDLNRISGYIMAEHVLEQGEIQRIALVPFIRNKGMELFFIKNLRKSIGSWG
jgi:tRNA threonylcarbamoyladenosine biosynthesis protein TsaB